MFTKLKTPDMLKDSLATVVCGAYLGTMCGVICGNWDWTPFVVSGVTGVWVTALALIGPRGMAVGVTVALAAAACVAWVGALTLAVVVAVGAGVTGLWCFAMSVWVLSHPPVLMIEERGTMVPRS